MALYAQYFDTTGCGVMGACRIHVQTSNPGQGYNTVPTRVDVTLREWDDTYTKSKTAPIHTVARYAIPSEEVQELTWIPLIFYKDLEEGKYIWFLQTMGPADGSFRVLYDAGSTKFNAWKNGVSHDDYQSELLGLDSESYELAISEGDTFGSNAFTTMNGVNSPQINTPGGYKKAISTYTTGAYVKSGSKTIGRIVMGSYVKRVL